MNRQLTKVWPIKRLFTYQADKDLNYNQALMNFVEMETHNSLEHNLLREQSDHLNQQPYLFIYLFIQREEEREREKNHTKKSTDDWNLQPGSMLWLEAELAPSSVGYDAPTNSHTCQGSTAFFNVHILINPILKNLS